MSQRKAYTVRQVLDVLQFDADVEISIYEFLSWNSKRLGTWKGAVMIKPTKGSQYDDFYVYHADIKYGNLRLCVLEDNTYDETFFEKEE